MGRMEKDEAHAIMFWLLILYLPVLSLILQFRIFQPGLRKKYVDR